MKNHRDFISPVRQTFINERGALGFGWVGAGLLFVTLTGLVVWLLPFSVGTQMAVLFHTVGGLLVLVPFTLWQLSHWLATRHSPRRVGKISAYAGFWLLAACLVSGLIVTWQGLFAMVISHTWQRIHLWTGVLALPFVAYHLYPRKVESSALPVESLPNGSLSDYGPARHRMWKQALGSAVMLCAVLVAATLSYREPFFGDYKPPPSFKPAPGENPFAPSNAEIENGRPASPLSLGNSRACGAPGCHSAIYEDWRSSAHRWSEEDQFFQAVRSATTEVQGIQTTKKCGGCHAPVSMLSGYNDPTLGKTTPGYFEGDSCIVCHAVRQADERGIGSYLLGFPTPYLYEYRMTRAATLVNHFLIRVYPTQHNRDYDLTIARKAESCAPCHKEYDVLDKSQGPMQVETQYDDWKHHQWNTDRDPARRLICQQCHMYFQEAPALAEGDPYDVKIGLDRKYHNHRFAAANQYMPLVLALPGAGQQVRDVHDWLSGERVIPEIAKVWPEGPIVALEIMAPASARPGGQLNLKVLLTNKKVGHSFPTGPLNIGRVWIELDMRDNSGREVFHSGHLDADKHLEPGSYALRPIALAMNGEPILTPDIWHPNGPIYRPAIFPGRSESFDYQLKVPSGAAGPLRVTACLRYRKANQFFLDAVYESEHREAPISDISSAATQIALLPMP